MARSESRPRCVFGSAVGADAGLGEVAGFGLRVVPCRDPLWDVPRDGNCWVAADV